MKTAALTVLAMVPCCASCPADQAAKDNAMKTISHDRVLYPTIPEDSPRTVDMGKEVWPVALRWDAVANRVLGPCTQSRARSQPVENHGAVTNVAANTPTIRGPRVDALLFASRAPLGFVVGSAFPSDETSSFDVTLGGWR